MRVLCFGGSFNPIHHGHLIVARAAAEAGGFDQILLIPSAIPPHKRPGPDLASAADRLTMCQLAIDGDPLFAVSDIEHRRSEPSFTLETARALREGGLNTVHWLIGEDTVPRLPTWHRPAELMAEVQFVVVRRPLCGVDWAVLPQPYAGLQQALVDAPMIDISATDIRNRVRNGKSIRFFTPDSVARFIGQQGLYQSMLDA